MQNGSFGHLMGQLDSRLARIEIAIDRLADELDGKHEKLNARVSDLENTRAKTQGSWTALTVIGGIAGTVGGFLSKWFPIG